MQVDKAKLTQRKMELSEGGSKVKIISTLRFKLIMSFMVPIAFIIIPGVVSLQKASK